MDQRRIKMYWDTQNDFTQVLSLLFLDFDVFYFLVCFLRCPLYSLLSLIWNIEIISWNNNKLQTQIQAGRVKKIDLPQRKCLLNNVVGIQGFLCCFWREDHTTRTSHRKAKWPQGRDKPEKRHQTLKIEHKIQTQDCET